MAKKRNAALIFGLEN